MGKKYFDGKVTNKKVSNEFSEKFIKSINDLDKKVTEKMDELQISDAISEIFEVLRASNKYIDETTPWILAKDENEKDNLETVLYNLLESIRVCASLLEPFLPGTSEEILRQINTDNKEFKFVEDNKYELNDPKPIFLRIDQNK